MDRFLGTGKITPAKSHQEVVEVAKDVVKRIEDKKQKNPYPL
jgi:hypothetical protein